MTVKLLTEHHLEFLSLKGGCTGSSESTLVKMSNCCTCSLLLEHIWTFFSVKDFSATAGVRILKFGTKLDSD